jgi:hypothetical protein
LTIERSDGQGEWFVNCYRKTTKGSMHSRQLCCGGLPL